MLARALVLAGCCLLLMGVTPAVAMRTTHVSTEGETFAGYDGAGSGVSEQMLDGVEPELSDDEELGQPTLVSPAPGSLISATSPVQMLPLRVDRDGDVFMQVQGVDCSAGPWAARQPVDWTVRLGRLPPADPAGAGRARLPQHLPEGGQAVAAGRVIKQPAGPQAGCASP